MSTRRKNSWNDLQKAQNADPLYDHACRTYIINAWYLLLTVTIFGFVGLQVWRANPCPICRILIQTHCLHCKFLCSATEKYTLQMVGICSMSDWWVGDWVLEKALRGECVCTWGQVWKMATALITIDWTRWTGESRGISYLGRGVG